MEDRTNVRIYQEELTQSDFNRLSKFIMTEYGIKMPPEKKIMLQSRLQKRLKTLHFENFKEYVNYVFSPTGQSEEVIHMMDVVSTNKTDFFRESAHFEYLLSDGLPSLLQNSNQRQLNIWSAGCSSGEEPYTIAMTLSEYQEHHQGGFDYQITASDLSSKMLEKASLAIYQEEKIQDIPHAIKVKYFLRSKDHSKKQVRVINKLRQKVTYYRQNLLFLPVAREAKYHIIFCRNVLIYFDRDNQQAILSRLCENLQSGGYLFLGHSESITGFELPVDQIKPTVFKKK